MLALSGVKPCLPLVWQPGANTEAVCATRPSLQSQEPPQSSSRVALRIRCVNVCKAFRIVSGTRQVLDECCLCNYGIKDE